MQGKACICEVILSIRCLDVKEIMIFSSLIDHFTCIVKVLFTLLYTQGLVALSVKCNEEDRSAWKHTGALKKVSVLSEFII